MSAINFDINVVNATTEAIKKRAGENLKTYATAEYNQLIESMESCSGSFKTAMCAELKGESEAVKATAEFIIKLQEMMQKTAEAFTQTDQSYMKGAMVDRRTK